MALLASARKHWTVAAGWSRQQIAILDSLQPELLPHLNLRDQSAGALVNLSFHEWFCQQPEAAIAATRRAQELHPNDIYSATNLLTGLLLTDQYEEALNVWEEYKDRHLRNSQTFGAVMLVDFQKLRDEGIWSS